MIPHCTGMENENRNLKRFGQNLKAHRLDSGFPTLRSLADKVGISYKSLFNIEAGLNWPSMPVYLRLCQELKLPDPPLF